MWLLGYGLHDRWENVQYEDYRGHQTWNEEDHCGTRAAFPQEPWAKRRPHSGVWCELSWQSAVQCQGCAETPFTCFMKGTQQDCGSPLSLAVFPNPALGRIPATHQKLCAIPIFYVVSQCLCFRNVACPNMVTNVQVQSSCLKVNVRFDSFTHRLHCFYSSFEGVRCM